ncbi:flagellar biosynthesis protein FlgG [Bacillus sp. FJAT-22090]|uniref:flagellar hook-basal body complex protein n=1 Tax=Bacillus sp. FJAT-22090 TaxID=1581038 RepID=UPI0006ADFDEE|nr:flagellar hook-basal body complex protein [Bacillus sp. FJAT-22090]ALC86024.1 flagellar biosynthesis protein FlgG [Bacillus sp. FJAT-22090]
MIRSMYSGISGLKNFQTKLDVIGNNISNVNTYGFKKGRTVFKDLISQTTSGASASTDTRGGVNAKQVGLGSQLSAIDTIHSGGSLQSTGNTLDLAISGDGFFIVADGIGVDPASATPGEFTNPLYTRAGNFYMDGNGYLINSDGKFVVGSAVSGWDGDPANVATAYPDASDVTANTAATGNLDTDADGFTNDTNPVTAGSGTVAYTPIRIPTNAQSMSIGQDGTVTFVDAEGTLKWAGQLVLAKFPNAGGLTKAGSNYFQESPNSGAPMNQVATKEGIGSVNSGFLEMSNVDLSEEFTDMIVAQRGFQANTRIITTSDQILEELVNLKR